MKGYHLLLNCHKCDKNKIDDMDYVQTTLTDLVKKINMELLCPPTFARAKPGEAPGVTGVLVITTSHVAIHTFTDDNMFWLDVFSCKMFNPRDVRDYIKEKFNVKKCKMSFHIR